jgi:hypothetical protein
MSTTLDTKAKYLTPEELSKQTTFSVGTLANWRANYEEQPKGPKWVKGRLLKDGSALIPEGNQIYYPVVEVERWLGAGK